MTQGTETPYLEGAEGKPFDLSGPYADGIIAVHPQGERLVAAKLSFRKPEEGEGRWEWNPGHAVHWDEVGKSVVDIRAAVVRANEKFPNGPERKSA